MDENEEFEFRQRVEQEQAAQNPNANFAANREKIEPGVMGETEPPEQKLLSNLNAVGQGYGMGQLGAGLASKGTEALAASKLGRAALSTPQEIGAQMGAGEKAAGVTSHLPELRGSKTRFPAPEMNVPVKNPTPLVPAETLPGVTPTSYPSDPNTFLNAAEQRMTKFGEKLSPQEITDYNKQIADWFSSGKIAKQSPVGAIASQTGKQASDIRNIQQPGRPELSDIYGLSKTLHPDVVEGLKQHFADNWMKYVGGVGAYNLFKH